MKKLWVCILCIFICLITSCSHLSVFTDDKPYISSLGKDGEYVFTEKLSITEYEKYNVIFNRISVAYNPSDNSFYGAVEGSFAKNKINFVLNTNKDIKKVSKGLFLFEKMNLSIMVPENGIILFATSDINKVFEDTYLNRFRILDEEITEYMLNSDLSFYVKNPQALPEFGFTINQEYIKKFEYVLCRSNNNLADFEFSLNDNNVAESLIKLLKTSVLAKVRKDGIRPDTKYLNSLVFKDENTVHLNSFDITEYLEHSLISSLTEVL